VTGGAIRMPPLASDDTSPPRRRNGWRHPAAAPASEVAVLDEVAARPIPHEAGADLRSPAGTRASGHHAWISQA